MESVAIKNAIPDIIPNTRTLIFVIVSIAENSPSRVISAIYVNGLR